MYLYMAKGFHYVPVCDFIEEFCLNNERQPVKLFPFQREFLERAFTPDASGKLPYDQVVFSIPKKSGKTWLSAAISVWYAFCMSETYDEIYVVANSLEHAESRAYKDIRRMIEMNPLLKDACKNIQSQNIEVHNGTIIKAISCEAGSVAGSNHSLVLFDELWACLPIDHPEDRIEVLTDRGWVSPTSITKNSILATRSIGNKLEWQNPTAINTYDYDGLLEEFSHRRCNFKVTPNHRVLAHYADNGQERSDKLNSGLSGWEPEYVPAREAKERAFGIIPQTIDYDGTDYTSVTIADGKTYQASDFFEFLGWYLSEGHCSKDRKGDKEYLSRIVISQSNTANPANCAAILQLIRRMGYDPKYSEQSSAIYFHDAKLAQYLSRFGLSGGKSFPRAYIGASKELLSIFLGAYLRGDGWQTGTGQWQAYTVSRQLADDIMEIGLRCGFVPRYMGTRIKQKAHWQTCHRISLSKKMVAWERRGGHWRQVHYKGRVWCPTLPNSNFYVRYNGTCFWTGNSQTEGGLRLWAEMTPVPTRKNSLRFVSTYAGFSSVSTLLESIYQTNVQERYRIDSEYAIYENKRNLTLWEHRGLCPWHTDEYYESQRANMRLSDFNRLHRNEWTAGEEGIPPEMWDAAEEAGKRIGYDSPPLSDKETILAVGIDAAYKKDRAAVVTCFKKNGKIFLGPRRWWQPTGDKNLDLEATIESYVLELDKKFTVHSCIYDPYQFVRSASALEKQGIKMIEFPQSQDRTIKMTGHLLDLLQAGNLILYPDIELRKEAHMVAIKSTERGRRFIKDKSNKKIDSIIALAMAALEAEEIPETGFSLADQMMVLRFGVNVPLPKNRAEIEEAMRSKSNKFLSGD